MKRFLNLTFQHRQKITLSLASLVFFISSLVIVLTQEQLRYPDEEEYNQLAENIAYGIGYLDNDAQPTAYRSPGYPFVLSLIYRFWNNPIAAKLLNAIALASTALLLSAIVAHVIPEGMVFAPLLVLLYPVFFYTSSTLFPQIIGALLLVSSVYCIVRFPNSPYAFAIAGILFGTLVLTIPGFLLLLPLLAVFLYIVKRNTKDRELVFLSIFVICSILIISPWIIRNAMLFKMFIPISTNSGENLLLGNSENTEPNSGVNVNISHYINETLGMNEAEKDAHLRRRAVDWIVEHPFQAGNLYLLKFINYFNFRNELYVQSESSALRNVIMFVTYYPLLILAVVRIIHFRRFPISWPEALLYILYIGGAFLSALFFTRIRFRLPYDALLIAIVAIFLGHLISKFKSQIAIPT